MHFQKIITLKDCNFTSMVSYVNYQIHQSVFKTKKLKTKGQTLSLQLSFYKLTSIQFAISIQTMLNHLDLPKLDRQLFQGVASNRIHYVLYYKHLLYFE